ncbi:MAG TPA: TonB-dependent receptor, partial [Gammaproteobacteria bacterium]
MRVSLHPKYVLWSSVCLALGVPLPSLADVIEEVVVTAQKREESVQDIPISVTAFTGDAAKKLGFINSVDIAAQTPGLNIGTPVGEGNNPSLVLRGVGLNDFNDNNESPVAMYRDDVYISAMAGQTFQLFDMQRVEVLRGPQGTLYGRNATGGLMHFISNKPTDAFEGYGDLTYGDYDQLKFEGALSGPLVQSGKVRARLAVAGHQHDGYVDNRIGNDANEADNMAGRLLVGMDLSDRLDVLVNVHGGESDVIAPKYQHQASEPGPNGFNVPSAFGTPDIYGYADTDRDPFKGNYDRDGMLNIETAGGSVTLNYAADRFTFTSITGVESLKKKHQEDTDMGPLPGVEPTFESDADQFSQEFRFSGADERGKWVAGLYYFGSEVNGDMALDVNFPGWLLGDPALLDFDPSTDASFDPMAMCSPSFPALDCVYPFFNYDIDYTQETDSYAIFGQYDVDVTDRNTLTLGFRYTKEKRDMRYLNTMDLPIVGVLDPSFAPFPAFDARDEIDNGNASGTLGIDHKFNDDMMVFAKVSRGFKSGGFNAGFLDYADGVTNDDMPYDEEILTSYEIGLKSSFPEVSTRFNATAFYYDYEDFQALSFSGLSQFISNSDATVYGLDAELFSSPVDGLDIVLGMSLLDTEVDEIFDRNTNTAIKNTEMVLAPEFTLNGLVRYAWPMAGGEVAVQADFNHQGDHYFDITNSPVAKEDAYTLWNARVSYTTLDEKLEVAAFVKNLSDEEYRVYTFDFTPIAGFN